MRALLLCHFHSAETLGRSLVVSHTYLLGRLEQLDKTTGAPSWAAGREILFPPNNFCQLPLGEAAPGGVDGFESGLLHLEVEWPWGLSHIKF